MLSRIQNFIEAGDHKINEIQVRFNKLPDIFNRYYTAQREMELTDNTDHTSDRELFENQYYQFKAKFNELLHPVVDPPLSRHSSQHSSLSGHSNNSPRLHASSAHIKLPVTALPTFEGDICSWLHFRDTFEALIVNNTALSNVQKFHYLIASLKNEAKDLISNLLITNENFLCCLVTSNTMIQQQMINCHDACQAFMSNAPSRKGRRIITAPVN